MHAHIHAHISSNIEEKTYSMFKLGFSVDATVSGNGSWLIIPPHHLFLLVLNSSAFSHLPLSFHGPGSWALWKLLLRDCLQPQALPAQFQGKGKAIPCLGHSESVSVSSASWCPQITFPHPSALPSALAVLWSGRERASAQKWNEDALYMLPYHTIHLDVIHYCSLALAISCSAMKLHTSCKSSHSLQLPTYIPSPLYIELHDASWYSMINNNCNSG